MVNYISLSSMVLTNTLTVVRLCVFEAFLFIVCVLGDNLISNTNSILGLGTQLSRVLIDSFTHGFVGFLSWAIIIDFSMFGMDTLECSGCMMLAMLVDTDHFIAARSLQLKVHYFILYTLNVMLMETTGTTEQTQKPLQSTIGWSNSKALGRFIFNYIYMYIGYCSKLFFHITIRYIIILQAYVVELWLASIPIILS